MSEAHGAGTPAGAGAHEAAEAHEVAEAHEATRAAVTYVRHAQAARVASLASSNSCRRSGSIQNRACAP